MRIGIFETTHFEGSYPVIRLFDNGINSITIFTYEESYRQFQHLFGTDISKYEWVVKKSAESKLGFLRRMMREVKLKKIDLLYLNTVADNFIFYGLMVRFLKRKRIVLTLHAINGFFQFKETFGLRRSVRNLGKKYLMKQVNEFNVVSLTMVPFLRQKLPIHKKVHCVPGAVYEGRSEAVSSLGNVFRIVVPGIIDNRRRDYSIVFQLLDRMNQIGCSIIITLLGGYNKEHGFEVMNQCRSYASRFNNLKFYEAEVVDQPEFDQEMDTAHLVLLPSTINTMIMDGIPEIYGITMSSGNLFDVIKHAKPFIAPIELKVDSFLENSCLRYNNVEDIVEAIRSISESPDKYLRLKTEAISASMNYTIEGVRRRNIDLFGDLL